MAYADDVVEEDDPFLDDGDGAPDDEAEAEQPDVDEEDLQAKVGAALDAAIEWNEDRDNERQENLQRWTGAPYGNEVDGMSRAVDRTCFDTVGWIMPALLEIFHGSDETGAFEPTGEEEVAGAEQATDLVNHIYARENPGFEVTAAVLQDALVERIGVWKTWWSETETVSASEHSGLSEEDALMLLEEEGVEIVSATQRMDDQTPLHQLYRQVGAPPPEPVAVLDLKIKRRHQKSKIRCEAVPPEEYGYEPGARSADAANLHYHVRLLPRADLIAMGYDEDLVNGLSAYEQDVERAQRRWDQDAPAFDQPVHESMTLVRYAEVYVRADFDEDGVAEWRKVCLAGAGWDLLHQEMVDGHPFDPVSPVLVAHKLEGLSIVDLVKDLQAIRTDIVRQMLDSLFEVSTPTMKVRRTAGPDTWAAVLNRTPGRPIPVSAPDDVMWETTATWQGGAALPFLEWLDVLAEKRTGVSRTAMGTNPDLLQNQTAAAVNQLMSAAQQKVGLIARILAECGFKRLFCRILRLTVKHQSRPRTIRVRGAFVAMDPADWNVEMDYVPNVGLGTGDKTKMIVMLDGMLAIQKEAMAAGLPIAGAKQVYNTVKERVKAGGLPTVEPFFVDPESEQARALARPPADPMADPVVLAAVSVEKIKQDAAMQRALLEDDRERDKLVLQTWSEASKAGYGFDLDAALAAMRAPRDANRAPMLGAVPMQPQPPQPALQPAPSPMQPPGAVPQGAPAPVPAF